RGSVRSETSPRPFRSHFALLSSIVTPAAMHLKQLKRLHHDNLARSMGVPALLLPTSFSAISGVLARLSRLVDWLRPIERLLRTESGAHSDVERLEVALP
ncbi:MAG: hypothetical protein KDB14_25250, partial [Planctomycetales bacterium]|nr:hypothetical protein [Planctomycetales bacterium]